MKLSCTSSAFSRAFDRGDLTQLEFLDAARLLGCDGVVLDERQFPRTDDDYLAQIKKMATDLGLTIAAIASDAFFGAAEPEMERSLRCAVALGAPILTAALSLQTSGSWTDQLGRLGSATHHAKQLNVTLAVRIAPETFAADERDRKRVAKEADSAWLCFAPSIGEAQKPSEYQLASRAVLLWASDRCEPQAAQWEHFGGFVVLDRPGGDATTAEMHDAMRRWHIARASLELNRK